MAMKKMFSAAALVVLGAVVLAAMIGSTAGQDVTSLLRNQQVVTRTIGCVLNRNSCDVIGKQVKNLLPEFIYNGCANCRPVDANNIRKVVVFMVQNHPSELSQILRMYCMPH